MRSLLGGHSRVMGLLAAVAWLAGGQQAGGQEPAAPADAAAAWVTTVFIVRHAEKASTPPVDPPLSTAGIVRAKQLPHVLAKTRLKAIYTTNTARTTQTVSYTATATGLTPIIYSSVNALAAGILSGHRGHRVLVAGHADTIQPIAVALGASASDCVVTGDEYDNLCVVTIVSGGQRHGVNLQYGKPSP